MKFGAGFQHDQQHRVGGPAVTEADGSKKWFIHGRQVTEAEHDRIAAQDSAQ